MPIPNKSIIDSLTETIKQKVDPAKLYDILQKVNQNIGKIYDTLFIGPLPPVSGEKLDLTALARTSLPPGIAFIDAANVFTENQTISHTLPTLKLIYDSAQAGFGRFGTFFRGGVYSSFFGHNFLYDGTNFTSDGAGTGSAWITNGLGSLIARQVTGIVTYDSIIVAADKIVRFGNPGTLTNAVAGDIVIPNNNAIRSHDPTLFSTYPLVIMDVNNIVQLGSKTAGNAFATGLPGIPTVVTADVPAAAAANNGAIFIEKTLNRFVFYNNGARYFVAGTAF